MIMSNNEYKIMRLLWDASRPLTRAEILNGTKDRDWNPASIHLILNSMISKGAIKITDETKKYRRTYEACISYYGYLFETLIVAVPDRTILEIVNDCNMAIKEVEE